MRIIGATYKCEIGINLYKSTTYPASAGFFYACRKSLIYNEILRRLYHIIGGGVNISLWVYELLWISIEWFLWLADRESGDSIVDGNYSHSH